MSRGSKIYRRFGLKLAIAFRIRRAKRKFLCKPFVREIQMFWLVLSLKNPDRFKIHRLLRKHHCVITSREHLEFILKYAKAIQEWLNSKEYAEKYLKTNHPYPPLLNPQWFVENRDASLAQSSQELEKSSINRRTALSQSDFSAQPTNLAQDTRIAKSSGDSALGMQCGKIWDFSQSTNKRDSALGYHCADFADFKGSQSISLASPLKSAKSHAHHESNASRNDERPMLSYADIPAELAWEMNLPLPRLYHLVWLRLDGSGSAAYGRFMKLCGINKLNADCAIADNINSHYVPCYNKLLAHKGAYNLIAIHEYHHKNYEKFLALVDKKVPALCNVRDQIERIKHGINHLNSWKCAPLTKRFNLTCEYARLFPILSYDACVLLGDSIKRFSSPYPQIESVYNYSNVGWRGQSIKFYQRLGHLKNLTRIEYVDMSEIGKNRAFETWSGLAYKFGFTPPKERDRYIFEGRINNNTGEFMHFPVVLYAHKSDIDKVAEDLSSLNLTGGIEIILTLKQRITSEQMESCRDITSLIFGEPLRYQEVRILVANDKLDELNGELFARAKAYLNGYMDAYQEELKRIKGALLSAEDVLKELKKPQNRHLYKHIKESLQKSLKDLATKRPEVIESWGYYQEFLKMCEEMD